MSFCDESTYTDIDETNMYRIIKIRMEVEEDVNPGLGDRAYVSEHVGRFRIYQLRCKVDVKPLQSVRDGPAKQGHVLGT